LDGFKIEQLHKLFEPIKISTMEVKNRIVLPPMGTRFADVSGQATQRHINHYETRAKGGAGLLIVPWVLVETNMERKTGRLRLDSDEYIRGLNEIVDSVHAYNAKIAIQLSQGGRAISKSEALGGVPVSSSVAYCPPYDTTARALTLEEIDHLVNSFAEASYRAKTAGFDAVEYHAASGYLISQFLSPFVNKRNDKYGGNQEKRLTFLLEIIERTREKVGKDYPLMVRISGDEFVKGGLTIKDNQFISQRLEEIGINCIDVTMGIVESYHKAMPPMSVPRAAYIHLAEGIKKVVNIPVIGVGRINDPILAESLLKEEKADLIAMGRALFADPDLPNKARIGAFEDINPCIACNRCEMATSDNIHVRCAVNPHLGNEKKYKVSKVNEPKNIIVIGGGPAGMTAATQSAFRGHKVTLYEMQDRLGGQLLLAAAPPHKEEIDGLISYLDLQTRKSGVNVILGEKFTPEKIANNNPDKIILATGAIQIIPRIPGIDGSNVVNAWDILSGKADTGQKVVVIGGGMVGLETAEYLAYKGKIVQVVEMLPDVGVDMEPFSKIFILERFHEMGVKITTSCYVDLISSSGVEAIDANWRRHKFESDTVVIAVGSLSNDELRISLERNHGEIVSIGDCREPNRILEAIHEGTRVAAHAFGK
jgi:2,4-dienoyl-CoA reductase-like NADH-dependent reductase (Old Yellow Enzyme family)/thioredoxin reductase